MCDQALQGGLRARLHEARVLGWVGPVEGGGCPHTCAVDFDAPNATDKLVCMHLDHERPVLVTCARWAAARPARRAARTGLGCVWEGMRWVSG